MINTNQYVLKAGDSLSSIADEVYGSVSNFRDIADANDLDLFSQLPVGKSIDLPTKEEVDRKITSLTQQASAIATQVDQLDLSSVKDRASTLLPHQLLQWVL